MTDSNDQNSNLVEAAEYSARYDWPTALACLDEILQAQPGHPGALDSRRHVLAQQDTEAQIVESISEARDALEAGRYLPALAMLDRAQALADKKRILNHHAEIAAIRDAARERMVWQEHITIALEKARAALGQAQRAYEAARGGDLAAVPWHELSARLNAAEEMLQDRPAGADPLPAAWAELQGQVADLRARTGVLYGAWKDAGAGREMSALAGLSAAAEQRPDDLVLAAVQARLRQEVAAWNRAQAQRLLGEARGLAERGELREAQERLIQARELDVGSQEVVAEQARLERQLKLLEKLNQSMVVGQTKLASNSPVEAIESFREVLQAVQGADSGLAEEVRTQLADLQASEARLYQEDVWAEANGLVAALGQAGTKNRILANYVLPSVRAWFELATHNAHMSFISSQQMLGQYLEAYGAAMQALHADPGNKRILQLAVENHRAVQGQLLSSAQKRLGRAKELCEKGYYAYALAELTSIEDSFMRQVRADHPEVIRDFHALDEVLDEAAALRLELENLQETAGKLEPLVAEIRQAYMAGGEAGLVQSERLIWQAELEDPRKTARLIWAELDNLLGLIRDRHQRAMAERIRGMLAAAEAELTLAVTPDAIRAVLDRLEGLRPDLEGLPSEDGAPLHMRVAEIAAIATTRLEHLNQAIAEEMEAHKLEAQGDLERSLAAFQRAAVTARGADKARLDNVVTRLEELLKNRRALDETWENALIAIETREYDVALQRLAQAVLKGKPEAEVEPYRLTAQAGQFYHRAQQIAGRDPAAARRLLERAEKLIESADFLPAYTLRRQIADALDELNKNEWALQRIAAVLRAAEDALRQGDRYAARAGLAGIEPDLAVLSEENKLRQQVKALSLALEAVDYQAMEQYDMALDLVKQALTLNGDLVSARGLKAQLLEEQEVANAVAMAYNLAREKKFSEANARLREAQEKYPRQPRLAAAQAEIEDVERRRQNEALAPARKAAGNKDYRTAVQEYARLIEQAGDADFKTELQYYQQEATNRWAEQVVEQTQAALRGDLGTRWLLDLRATVQDVIGARSAPAGSLLQQLRSLLRAIEARRLWQRLADGQQALERADLDLAEKIGIEVQGEVSRLEDFNLAAEVSRFSTRITRARWIMLTSQAGQLIRAEDYDAARQCLAEAMRLDRPAAEIAPYLRAVEAGDLMQRAQAVQDQDILESCDLLRKIIGMVADFAPAQGLLERARTWLMAIERDVTDLPSREAHRFLARARFRVELLDDQSLLCRSDAPMWSEFSPFLLKVLLNYTLNVDKTIVLRDHARAVFDGTTHNRVVIAMVDHQLAPYELQQIMSLRAQEGLTVVPVTRVDLSAPERISDGEEWLLRQIELFAGKVDLLNITEPVADALSFFGREQILADLERRLLAGHPSIVFGVRKIGKSSLLMRMNTMTLWPTAKIDLQAHASTLGKAFLEAVQAWQRSMGLGHADLISTSAHPQGLTPQAFRQHVVTLLDALESSPGHPGLILLLDEVEYLFETPDGLQFAGVLRSFKGETRYGQRFSLLAASKDPARANRTSIISGDDNPFYGFFVESPLGCLESEATKNMISSISLHMGIDFDMDALEELTFWSGGHPFITRQLLSQVIGHPSRKSKLVNIRNIHQALHEYSEWTGNYFRTCLWPPPPDAPGPLEAALLCKLANCQALAKNEWLPEDLASAERQDRQGALDHLLDQSLVRRNGDAWELTIPLYGVWIRREILSQPSSFKGRG